jgi:hypothetical protein
MRMKQKELLACFVALMFSITLIPPMDAQNAYKMIDNPNNIRDCLIDWPYVVYMDDRNAATTGYDLFCRNISTGDEWTVSSLPNDEHATYIGNGYIIYDVDYGAGDIDVWGHHITTRTSFPIFTGGGTMQAYGFIYGGRYVIAYIHNTPAGHDVIAYDLTTSTYIHIATTAANEYFFDVSGNRVIYGKDTLPPTNADIYAYNLLTTATVPIATGPNNEFLLASSSNYLVYQELVANALYLYKFSDASTALITNAAVTPGPLRMSESFVVWQDWRNATAPDIYGYSIAAGTEFPICTAANHQNNPWITDNLVFWDDNRADPDGTPFNWGTGGTDAWHVYGKYLPNGAEFLTTGALDPYVNRNPITRFDEYLVYFGGDHRNAFTYGYAPPGPPYPPADVYIYNYKEGKEYTIREQDSPKFNIRMTTMSPDNLVYWLEEEASGDTDIWGYVIPGEEEQFINIVAAFMPMKNHHLAEVNEYLSCIEGALPDDIPDDIQDMLDAVQEHIENANTTGNTIYANNELLKAIDLCDDVAELLGITCW